MNVNKIREDFPVLKREINGKPIIYFDNACQTLKPLQVINAMNQYYYEFSACGGRSAHRLGVEVTMRCDEAREKVQRFLNASSPREIVFTKNSTESINTVARGLELKEGDIVITTDKEHNSNFVPWQVLKREKGILHLIVKSNDDGTFNIESFEESMSKRVKLVSMSHTSNLDGVTIPAEDVIKIAHDYNALVMLDGAQSAPHRRVDVKRMDVDFFALSVHKMCGPTGMGILYSKEEWLEQLKPLTTGGGAVEMVEYEKVKFLKAPEKFEAGLQNYAGIIGTGSAIDYLEKIGMDNIERHEIKLNRIITKEMESIQRVKLLGPKEPMLRGGNISFNVDGMNAHDVAMLFDGLSNVMLRSGMQCVHAWFDAHNIKGSVRASVYIYNTEEECKIFIDTLKKIAENFSQ